MADGDDLSLTPPLSPVGFILEELIESPPKIQDLDELEPTTICFQCLGAVTNRDVGFHAESFLKTRFLSNLCEDKSHNALPPTDQCGPSLFTHHWTSQAILDTGDMDRLFLTLRQQIGMIQVEAVKSRMSFQTDTKMSCEEERRQVNEFLQYLLDTIQCSVDLPESTVEKITSQLHTTLLHIGRLTDLPHHITQSVSHSSKMTCSSQCYHVHLDVYWRLLSILHTIQRKYPGFQYSSALCNLPDADVDICLYDQLVQIVLWDLVTLANSTYINKSSESDDTKISLYSCSCVKELWVLMLKLSQWRAQRHMGETFWVSVHHVIRGITDLNQNDGVGAPGECMDIDDCRVIINPPEGLHVRDKTSFCLWLMYSIAPLYAHKVPGYTLDSGATSNYHDLQPILKKFITSPSVTEPTLRHHLRTCHIITSQWEPNISLLVILWDYFYRKLNETFQNTTSILDGLACVDNGVASFYDKCKHWSLGGIENIEKEKSFHLFLRILCNHLGRLYSNGCTQDWKQMKGRIYSKFHQRRVQELQEGGLYNLTSLFVTLAMTTDLEDVASKLCDFYDFLDVGRITIAKRSVIWRGAFTMILVYEERHMDVSFLVDRIIMAFDSAVNEYKVASIDSKHSLWKLLLIYLEGLQEVIETSTDLQTSEYKLLSPGIKTLLTICSENELRKVLSTLESVANKFRQISTSDEKRSNGHPPLQHVELAGALWRNVYPFVVDHATTLTPPQQLADLAVTFSRLTLTFPPKDIVGSSDTFVTVFKYFASGERVNVNLSCRFLGHQLSSADIVSQLRQEVEKYERFIISAWYRCCLYTPAGSQQLAEVTRSVLQLPVVRDMFTQADLDIPCDLDIVPVQFLKAIEGSHRKTQSWQDKMKLQEEIIPYFCDVPRHIAPVLKTLGPHEVLSNVYRMTGYLVKYCAKLIYVRQDVILPNLISSMIVPHHVMNPDKPVNPVLLSVVKENLHLFIQGLGKLSFDRDPFVQRRLKDIVIVYLPKFSLRSSLVSLTTSTVTSVHPIVASLSGSFIQQPRPDAVKLRHFILKLVINNFMSGKTTGPTTMGVTFLHDVLQRTISSEVKARDLPVILGACLEHLLVHCDQPSATFMSVLQQTTEACNTHSEVIPLSELSFICDKFLTNHIKVNSSSVIKVFEKLALLQQEVVISVVEKMSSCIRTIETKRGVGVDHKIRQKYYQLLENLGTKGLDEITRMKSNS